LGFTAFSPTCALLAALLTPGKPVPDWLDRAFRGMNLQGQVA
jgi:hypothetical protein